jgi:hypothetical protein
MLNIFNKYNTTILFSIFAFFISACGNEYSTKLPDENYKCEIQNPEYKFLEETPCICNKNCALKAFNDLIIGEDGYIAKWEGDEPVEIRIVGKNMEEDFYEVKSLIEKPVKILNTATPFDLRIVYDPEADQNIYQRSILIFYVDDIEDAIRNDFPYIIDEIGRDNLIQLYLANKNKVENAITIKIGDKSEDFVFNILFLEKKDNHFKKDKLDLLSKLFFVIGFESTSKKEKYSNIYDPNNGSLYFFLTKTLYNQNIKSGMRYKDIEKIFDEIYFNQKTLVSYLNKKTL